MDLRAFTRKVRSDWETEGTDAERYRSFIQNFRQIEDCTDDFTVPDTIIAELLALPDEPLELLDTAEITDGMRIVAIISIGSYLHRLAEATKGEKRTRFGKRAFEAYTKSAEIGLKTGNMLHVYHAWSFAGNAAKVVAEGSREYSDRMDFGKSWFNSKLRAAQAALETGDITHSAYGFSFAGVAAEFIAMESRNPKEKNRVCRKMV